VLGLQLEVENELVQILIEHQIANLRKRTEPTRADWPSGQALSQGSQLYRRVPKDFHKKIDFSAPCQMRSGGMRIPKRAAARHTRPD